MMEWKRRWVVAVCRRLEGLRGPVGGKGWHEVERERWRRADGVWRRRGGRMVVEGYVGWGGG